ncbi:MAG: hypothetical protein JXK04_09470 [Campylobacterales bacterium]|nr:hypothetical protein [Campylobacterales bacterium]
MSTPHSSDIFEKRLQEATETLRGCQQEHGLESCYPCPECVGCEIRAKYVRTVYESMSKGETGGFDF